MCQRTVFTLRVNRPVTPLPLLSTTNISIIHDVGRGEEEEEPPAPTLLRVYHEVVRGGWELETGRGSS